MAVVPAKQGRSGAAGCRRRRGSGARGVGVALVDRGRVRLAYQREVQARISEKAALTREVEARNQEAKTRYFNNILMAEHEWYNSNARRAGQLLDDCIPKSGEDDLRGWEWHYLDRQRHSELRVMHLPAGGRHAVAFSPDGKRFISQEESGNRVILNVRDAETGALVHALRGHSSAGQRAAFSRDGTLIASSSGLFRYVGRSQDLAGVDRRVKAQYPGGDLD
jgi:hypothetical protein